MSGMNGIGVLGYSILNVVSNKHCDGNSVLAPIESKFVANNVRRQNNEVGETKRKTEQGKNQQDSNFQVSEFGTKFGLRSSSVGRLRTACLNTGATKSQSLPAQTGNVRNGILEWVLFKVIQVGCVAGVVVRCVLATRPLARGDFGMCSTTGFDYSNVFKFIEKFGNRCCLVDTCCFYNNLAFLLFIQQVSFSRHVLISLELKLFFAYFDFGGLWEERRNLCEIGLHLFLINQVEIFKI